MVRNCEDRERTALERVGSRVNAGLEEMRSGRRLS